MKKSLGVVFALVIAVLILGAAAVPAGALIKPPQQEAGSKVLYSGEPDVTIPTLINYQGYLTDSGGNPINGIVDITFTIYDAATDGSAVWIEVHPVTVNDGLFSVLLGSLAPIDVSLFTGTRYLGISVEGEPEMTPRQQIVSVAYALRADEANNANRLDGMDSNQFVAVAGDTMTGTLNMGNNAITNIDWATSDDGTGSGLDADTLDGMDSSAFAGDNLGDHTATQNINLNGNYLSGDGDSEGVFVNAQGNVGMGTNSPTEKLSITKTSPGSLAYALKLNNLFGQTAGTATGILFNSYGNNNYGKGALVYELEQALGWGKGSFHFLQNPGSDATLPTLSDSVMTIKNNGKVGIGTTSPGTKLAVDGLPSTSSYSFVRIDTSTGDFYIDSSSQRYKKDIQDFEGDFDKIFDAEPKSYVDKVSGQREIGYIAEDLNELGLTDLVIYNNEGEPDGLKYDRISLYLVEIIETQQAQIEDLLERVKALEQANQ